MDAVKKPHKELRSEWVMTTLTPAERQRIEQAAAREGLSMSAVIRRAVLRDLGRGSKGVEEDWPEGGGR